MRQQNPLYMDVTWGAGGSTSELTVELCKQITQKYIYHRHLQQRCRGLRPACCRYGQVANMHLTCTNMPKEKVCALRQSQPPHRCRMQQIAHATRKAGRFQHGRSRRTVRLGNFDVFQVDQALADSKEIGIQNIVALRGDPPAGQEVPEHPLPSVLCINLTRCRPCLSAGCSDARCCLLLPFFCEKNCGRVGRRSRAALHARSTL